MQEKNPPEQRKTEMKKLDANTWFKNGWTIQRITWSGITFYDVWFENTNKGQFASLAGAKKAVR